MQKKVFGIWKAVALPEPFHIPVATYLKLRPAPWSNANNKLIIIITIQPLNIIIRYCESQFQTNSCRYRSYSGHLLYEWGEKVFNNLLLLRNLKLMCICIYLVPLLFWYLVFIVKPVLIMFLGFLWYWQILSFKCCGLKFNHEIKINFCLLYDSNFYSFFTSNKRREHVVKAINKSNNDQSLACCLKVFDGYSLQTSWLKFVHYIQVTI